VSNLRSRSLEAAREHAVQLLSHHYAHDRLSLEEVEQRLELAYRARTIDEVDVLLADLPAAPGDEASTGERPFYQLARPGEGAPRSRLLSFFAEVKRRGAWAPARQIEARIIFGSMLLDLREARLQPGVTEIDASVVFGELKVMVPPGVRVVSEGSAIFGSFDHSAPEWDELAPDAPTVRITGSAVFGSTRVIVRLPGESGLAALRRKWEI
jgi:hypothetical protein